jgi:hypothetical protein
LAVTDKATVDLILKRMKKIHFHDQEETYIRKLIKNFKIPNVKLFLSEYLKCNPKKTFLFPIMIDEVSKVTKEIYFHLEGVLNLVELMDFEFKDSNILKFHSESIKLICTKKLGDSRFNLLEFILIKGNPIEDQIIFNLLYSDFKLILLKSDLSENYVNFLSKIFDYIPREDSLKIFERILFEFNQKTIKTKLAQNFFLAIFDDYSEENEDYSQQ